jgi:hypothetical protein
MTPMQQNRGQQVIAVTLIAIGVLFLLAQVFQFSLFGALWPFFVILPGAVFLYAAFNGDKHAAGLIIPGNVITGTGLILLYQNLTGHWESWAYVWILYPVFVGLGLMFMGRRRDNANEYRTGRNMAQWGGMAFLIAAAIFELGIFGSNPVVGSWLLPLALILLGGYMLTRRGALPPQVNIPKRKNDIEDRAIYMGSRVVGTRTNGRERRLGGDDLQRRIDEALAEDDPPKQG